MDGSQLSIFAARALPPRTAGLLVVMLSALAMMTAGGCTTLVRPPGQPLQQPTTVYLTDEFIHSSVIVPTDDGRHVEYAFGDWAYAGLNRQDPFHTLQALFFSPQGALGRRYLTIDPASRELAPQLKGVAVNRIVVEREQVRELLTRLDARYRPDREQAVNPDNQFLWVPVNDAYALWSNCNSLTKTNLRRLGCDVQSRSLFAMYEVQLPRALMFASASGRSIAGKTGTGKMR